MIENVLGGVSRYDPTKETRGTEENKYSTVVQIQKGLKKAKKWLDGLI